jgi:ketosteroid isomerase-like protein
MKLKRLLLQAPLLAAFASGWPIRAQSNAQSGSLFKTIQALDSKLFEAYNHCDLATLGAMVSDDLEFYHDQTGLSVGRDLFVAAIKQNICGKVERSLVPGSLEVYPLNGYGAVEIGVHRFRHPGHPEDTTGEAKFITLWQNKDGSWRLTRAISYDHQPVKK